MAFVAITETVRINYLTETEILYIQAENFQTAKQSQLLYVILVVTVWIYQPDIVLRKEITK